jgi:hypothetical protein
MCIQGPAPCGSRQSRTPKNQDDKNDKLIPISVTIPVVQILKVIDIDEQQ